MKFLMRLFFLIGLCIPILGGALHLIFPFPENLYLDIPNHHGHLILDHSGKVIDMRVGSNDQYCFPIEHQQISQHLIDATLAAEDQRFHEHYGIDILALCRAVWQNTFHGRRISGASTISMQVIKLLHKKPRTYFQKLLEMWHTLLLEQRLSKREIIQLYLNLAPYGSNIVGCEAASRIYFQKACRELSQAEAYLLAGLPQKPSQFYPLQHLDRALKRRAYILQQLFDLNIISREDIKNIEQEKMVLSRPTRQINNIRLADHLIQLKADSRSLFRSSIDLDLKEQIDDLLQAYREDLKLSGIHGFSLVVLNSKSHHLISLNNGVLNTDWMNYANVKRQPGSLFKPFIYNLAYEKGWLTPGQMMNDHFEQWGNYRPNNHDKKFYGQISASKALQLSRNLPAVSLIHKLKPKTLWESLQSMNLKLQQSSQELGLSLALGTPEVSLLNICNAYATLINDGQFKNVLLSDSQHTTSHQVFQPGVSALTLHSLGARQSQDNWSPALKTGTSWQQRDAWCIAMSPNKIVGVWIGLGNGLGHDAIMGSQLAQPIATDVLNSISEDRLKWTQLEKLNYRHVCSDTGLKFSYNCSHKKREPFLPGISSESPCLHPNTIKEERPLSPKDNNLVLTSPLSRSQYLFQQQNNNDYLPIRLKGNPDRKLYWFLNGKYYKTTQSNHHNWQLPMKKGSFELSVSDSLGNQSSVKFEII